MLRSDSDDTALLLGLLDRCLDDARVRIERPGETRTVGRGGEVHALRVTDAGFATRVLAEGNLGLAETFMDGGWEMVEGSLEGMLTAFVRARLDLEVTGSPRALARMAALRVKQLVRGTDENVRAHYDVGDEIYASFLDPTRGYTCGYQITPEDTSQQLQEQKYERVLRKLRVEPGMTLFDIGCGYGSLVIHAAQHFGATARGITNSHDHAAFAQRRIRALGLQDRVSVELGDFREARGTFDRVVSCGVLEHLYPREHRDFFEVYRRLLRHGGYGLVHTIGCVTPTNDHDPFIQKYIFPGSTQNPLSHIAGWIERMRLGILDVENVGRHYAPTSRAWLAAYRANRHTLDPARYDARFQRMWEYYLALCVAGASASDGAVWQVLFTSNYRRDLPLHRV
jgi:cyclopropane-fatty-acyl-phospholipid synthase